MLDNALHRQVALAALVALAGVAGAAAGAPAATDDVSERSVSQLDATVAQADETNQSQNVTASFVHDDERVVLHPHEDQTVRLQTNADAGTTLTVEVRVNGSFVMESLGEVSENGTATAPIDGRSLGAGTGTEVSLIARHDDRELAETTGIVTEVSTEFVHDGDRLVLENATNQTVRVRTDAEPGRELVFQMQGDQFIRTSPANVSADGTATATFDLYDLPSGTEFTLQVSSGDAETAGVILNESAMAALTTTETPTATTTDETETTRGDGESGVPGFGVPVALLATAAGLALARRM